MARIACDTALYYMVDAAATTAKTYLPADQVEYRAIRGGQTLNVILASGTATVSVEWIKSSSGYA